jgi:hypothetical protein
MSIKLLIYKEKEMKSLKRFSRTTSISLVMVLVIALVGVVPAMAGKGGPPQPISNNTIVSIDGLGGIVLPPFPALIGTPVAVNLSFYGRAGVVLGGTVAVTGADVNCSVAVVAGAVAVPCNVTFNSAGAKTLTATYTPGAPLLPSTDTAAVLVPKIVLAAGAVVIIAPAAPFVVGIPGPLAFSVTGAGTAFPTGTVAIQGTDDNCILTLAPTAVAPISSGSCNTRFDTVAGGAAVIGNYSGDVNYTSVTSVGAPVVVNKGVATLTITSISPSPAKSGVPVTLSVEVTGAGAIPTGAVNVAVSAGYTPVIPVPAIPLLVAGKGSYVLNWGGPPGLYTVTATYVPGADPNYTAPALPTTINHRNQLNRVVYYSLPLYDGYVDGNSGLPGGTFINSTDGFALAGDTADNDQSRPVFYFNTSPLPNGATVTKARLFLAREGVYGTDPFSVGNPLLVDVNTGSFSGNPFLELADWNAFTAATYTNDASISAIGTTGKKWAVLLDGGTVPAGPLGINDLGPTQFRLAFSLETNANDVADYWKIYTGEATQSWNRPRLIVWYYVP